MRSGQYWIHTLGLPKEPGRLRQARGHPPRRGAANRRRAPEEADLVVVNTCAFIEPARQESIETILELHAAPPARRRAGRHRLSGGALRRRAGRGAARDRSGGRLRRRSLTDGLPPGRVPVGARRGPTATVVLRPARAAAARRSSAPWAYLKVAEGCDRACGFCAIPTFRGKQRSRRHARPDGRGRGAGGGRARRPAGARDRPRRPGPRLLRAGPLDGRGARAAAGGTRRRPRSSSSSAPSPRCSTAPACSTCTRRR